MGVNQALNRISFVHQFSFLSSNLNTANDTTTVLAGEETYMKTTKFRLQKNSENNLSDLELLLLSAVSNVQLFYFVS